MIFDLHNDLITSDCRDKESIAKKYSQYTRGVVLAIWMTNYKNIPSVENYKNDRIFFSVEDLGFFDASTTEELISLKPVYCGLTWNYNNGLAGGAFDDGELTSKGKTVIEILNRNDIIIDLAHLNGKSFYQVIDRADRVICSHTSLFSLKKHPRNITDEQVKLIMEKGGVIGLTPVADFLESDNAYFRTIDYALSRYGESAFSIGTDIYGSKNIPNELQRYDGYIKLYEYLEKCGTDSEIIDKVAFKNAYKVLGIN